MNRTILPFMLSIAFLFTSCGERNTVRVKSPGSNVEATVRFTDDKVLLSVSKNGNSVLPDSPLGLTIDDINIGEYATRAGKVSRKTIHEEYGLYGNHSHAVNHCSEVSVPIESRGINYRLQVRTYDDGVAVRYIVPSNGKIKITGDQTAFRLPDSAVCYWANYAGSNEELHQISRFDEMPQGAAIVAPLTVKTENCYLSFSEARCLDFPDMSWIKEGNYLKANFPANPEGWTTEADTTISPWRLAIVADDLPQLVNSDLITNLCEAPKPGYDFSWVQPGRVLWHWWAIGGPKLEDQEKWYDAAARLTWEYYLIDGGWKAWHQQGKDHWQCLKEVIDYGKSQGVKTLVWVHSKEVPDRESLRIYLEKIKQAGAAGIKIDFIPKATPEIMQWYETAREETYRLQLLCNFHGCVKPTGLQRTWPHEMTREGVRGNEWQITRYDRLMPRDQDEIIPFTRFIAGPADFTPVIFNPKELRGYTWAHELAQAVVYCSPLTHFADEYGYYLNNPAEDILRDIPVTWDETVVLSCTEIGKVVAIAKRKGNDWWLAIMNGEKASEISFSLDFLSASASATILSDKENIPNAFVREERVVKRTDIISLLIKPGGGYFMMLETI